MKREAKANTVFMHWLKTVYKQTGAFELKQTTGNSIPFDAVAPHQIAALEAANHGVLAFKIPDGTFSQSPFDCFTLAKVPAYVVIKYPKCFELIAIDTFTLENKRSKRRSLTSERAHAISTITIDL
jgi:hypothetical protein